MLLRAYKPDWFRTPGLRTEAFSQPKAMGPPKASPINVPLQPVPAPAPAIRQPPLEEERTVAPGGPGAPNAAPSSLMPASISPEAAPLDPYDNNNMEAPIKDSMRHPELSFGPGVENRGIKKGAASGVMNKSALTSESPFSPEFAQNGGQFMGAVTANDLSHGDEYATA
jgi:hypothetical protein